MLRDIASMPPQYCTSVERPRGTIVSNCNATTIAYCNRRNKAQFVIDLRVSSSSIVSGYSKSFLAHNYYEDDDGNPGGGDTGHVTYIK